MTGPAVDLDAVRTARRALAAIVAEHPELTSATARARLAEHLPEIIVMKPLDSNATGPARTITVRLSADLIARLETERDRLAALVPGASLGLSDAVRSFILRAVATPAQTAPAAPAAPAPSRPVASPAAPVAAPAVAPVVPVADSRQLPLLAPSAPFVVLHKTTDGQSVATVTGNDNDAAPTTEKRPRKMPPGVRADGSVIDLADLRARLDAAIAENHSIRSIAKLAGVNDSGIAQWHNRTEGLGASSSVKLDAALRTLGF